MARSSATFVDDERVHLHTGTLCPTHQMGLNLWNNFEQTGYYRRWGEVNLFIIHAMSFGTPLTRLMRLVLDLLFFFCFGFLLPCCEAWLILLN